MPWGGAWFSEHPQPGKTADMLGSVMIVCADTKEEVLELLEKDIYTQSKVWNLSKVQIWPFKSAIRKGLQGGD